MIQLNISAGYAWTVWDDRGGLQPRIDSLNLPSEICAQLKAWTFRGGSAIHSPTFTGRKEFDVEGRATAAELQRSVGDRLHVIFRCWVKFDPKRWQALWRGEDLLSGEVKEFWLEEDLSDELAVKVVRIFPDCGGAYLWDLNSGCIGNEDPVFPGELDERLTAWSESWDACFDPNTMKTDKARLAKEGFDDRGLALAAELKHAIGEAAKVVYYCNLREAALEILPNGTIEWPRDTDFRQWALDHEKENP